jgi:hypothetical protein
MNARLNSAVEQLLLDDGFLRRFRRNPDKALARHGLSADEIAAVKRGDASELLALGLDPELVAPQERGNFLQAWLVRHAKRLSPAVVLAAFLLPAAPAVGARRVSARRASHRPTARAHRRAVSARALHAARARRAGRYRS